MGPKMQQARVDLSVRDALAIRWGVLADQDGLWLLEYVDCIFVVGR